MEKLKVYEALYCECIYESSFATISLHLTKLGAKKAIKKHKKFIKKQFKDLYKNSKFKPSGKWNSMQAWKIIESEIQE